MYEDEGDDEGANTMRSRGKEDIFHQFKVLPMQKICPGRYFVMELLIYAALNMDTEHFKAWKEHLEAKEGIDNMTDLMDHFVFNKEAWRSHIPMFTPQADEHLQLIKAIHTVICNDKELKKYRTEELDKYFETFQSAVQRGYYEELEDVVFYEQNGHDKYGLPLFIRKKGTVRAENLHQKTKMAIGPWGIGARSAHYLMLLLQYRYNVAAGIRRRGYHSFGHLHCELYLIDRIQIRIHEIYNVQIYPDHQNLMEFASTGLAWVGIVPLSYNVDYANKRLPNCILKGDLWFLAIDVCGGSNKCKCKDHHMYNSNYTDEELKKAKQRMQNEEKAQRKAKRNKKPDENT
eukprot:scaffold223105_cov63-Attheya_sp.AAC.1